MKPVAFVVVALFSLFLATGVAWGASSKKELVSHFSLTEKYDDNPSRGSNSFDRTQREGGWITALRSQALFRYLTDRSQIQLDYQAGREFYHSLSRLNNTAQSGTFSYIIRLTSRLRGGVSDSLRITEDVDTDLDPRGLRFSSSYSRSRKRSNALNLFLEPQLSGRLGLRLDYSNTLTDVEMAYEADELQHDLGVSLNYLADTRRSDVLSLAYRVSIHTFDENEGRGSFLEDGEGEDFLTHTVQLGYTRHLSPTLSLALRGGLSRISSDDPEADGEQELTGGVTLTQVWAMSRFSLGFSREMGSGGRGSPALSQTLLAFLSHQFSPRLQASLSGSYSENDSRGDDNGLGNREEDSTYWSMSLNVGYQVSNRWSAAASYLLSARHPQKDGDQDGRQRENEKYQNLQVGFHFDPHSTWKVDLTYTFSRREGRDGFDGREGERPERNQLWLTVTMVTPWRF